ncbi:hypothetical protein MES5069_200201 [Mesorhizobium escarrei]|uniref:Uncharacterized protein n=1 Tax=Mesorhizobium escarrei TaxID=666018 RepID=A0ABM9DQ84_9HYPH|nr:hypothetical protein MES5069_200201 [Mesorhizobium escarrei]
MCESDRYSDGEKDEAAALTPPSPRHYTGGGKGEGQRQPLPQSYFSTLPSAPNR